MNQFKALTCALVSVSFFLIGCSDADPVIQGPGLGLGGDSSIASLSSTTVDGVSSVVGASSTTAGASSTTGGTSSVVGGTSSTNEGTSSSTGIGQSVDTGDKISNITKTCTALPTPISGGQKGHGSRYWDCCKPSCSWRENVDTTATPFSICKNCNFEDEEIPAFQWAPTSNQYWEGYEGVTSGCESGGTSYTCNSQAPFAVCEDLAYAYVAVQPADGGCGKCFQFDFDGGGYYGDKDAHKLLKGKTMIVMASNIGPDVVAGQFDIMIPGGGVGIHNGCSAQWDVSKVKLGAQYGGFLQACNDSIGSWDLNPEVYKTCVRNKCDEILGGDPKLEEAWQGCNFFVDWMHAADNPTFTYKEVECPAELVNGYTSTFHTSKDLPKTW